MTFEATITTPDPQGFHALKLRARARARKIALDALSSRQRRAGETERGLAVPRVHFPYLHAVPEHEEPALRELLESLSKTSTFISYSEAYERVISGDIDRPYVAFSFDDGFASNERTARLLEEFGAPGMFFVPPGFLGVDNVPEARRFFGFSEGVDEPAMTWDDLESLLGRGHEIGNHTRYHQVLSWVTPEVMRDEVGEGADLLRSRVGEVRHFAWPRGRFEHFTEEAGRTVYGTGHASCASAERGAHTSRHDGPPEELCLRRDHLMTEWPVEHMLYFLARSALRGAGPDAGDGWPAEWEVTR